MYGRKWVAKLTWKDNSKQALNLIIYQNKQLNLANNNWNLIKLGKALGSQIFYS